MKLLSIGVIVTGIIITVKLLNDFLDGKSETDRIKRTNKSIIDLTKKVSDKTNDLEQSLDKDHAKQLNDLDNLKVRLNKVIDRFEVEQNLKDICDNYEDREE